MRQRRDRTPRREPWCFGDEVLPILRAALKLRYRLLPYWYTLAHEATTAGHPLVRPLFWMDPSDRGLRPIDDAFLVGPHLLVAPILREGARARDVRLPKGTWVDFHTGERHEGGDTVHVEAPFERIPVFVKAGALIPMDVDGALELHAWPDRAGRAEGTLYHNAGDGHGPWCLLRYTLDASGPAGPEQGRGEPRLDSTREGDGPAPEPAAPVILHR